MSEKVSALFPKEALAKMKKGRYYNVEVWTYGNDFSTMIIRTKNNRLVWKGKVAHQTKDESAS